MNSSLKEPAIFLLEGGMCYPKPHHDPADCSMPGFKRLKPGTANIILSRFIVNRISGAFLPAGGCFFFFGIST
jgi:hypothetical protein